VHLHILGICGTFMGGIAAIASQAGHRVTGCDANVYPPMSAQLAALGIELIEGWSADQLRLAPDLWVVGNVVTRGNPLMEAILDRGERFVSGPQWLAEHFLYRKWVLAVAGTHGKTTVSAMLAWILQRAGREPGFLIGGVPADFEVSARASSSSLFVIEADEYDTAFFDKRSKFLHYRGKTVVLNNLEFDHADIFGDLADIERQFHHYVRTIQSSGRIVLNGRDEALKRVLTRGCWTPCEVFGSPAGWEAGEPDGAGAFEVAWQGRALGRVRPGVGAVLKSFHRGLWNLLADEPFDFAQLLPFVRGDQGNGVAGRFGPGRPADPMDIILRHFRQLVIDHVGDPLDVESACGQIGGHKHLDRTAPEGLQRLGAGPLAFVAVDGGDPFARPFQLELAGTRAGLPVERTP